ncbi:hypothetical protein [Streptomyces sp. NBC_01602]|uniref:hypothetical protein n=1 Tax=Streptomyces sp. NBC_01602 TaxID=2975893 RepID=UPI00386AA413|nr:hypothetical protein OG955_04585 [Streptomyces sp. NBC_01602]
MSAYPPAEPKQPQPLKFVPVAAPATLSLSCPLIPTACIVDYRIGRRVVTLSQRDKSAPARGLHRGLVDTADVRRLGQVT